MPSCAWSPASGCDCEYLPHAPRTDVPTRGCHERLSRGENTASPVWETPSYRRVDARWTRFFDTRDGRVSLFAEVYNLFGIHNRRGYSKNVSIDPQRRQVTFVRANEDWIPRLPTVGITWEFGGASR